MLTAAAALCSSVLLALACVFWFCCFARPVSSQKTPSCRKRDAIKARCVCVRAHDCICVLTSSVGGSEDDDTTGETLFKRTIIGDNTSEYRIDGKKVTEKEYQAKLKSIGLLVKSRNFLVFQNEVTKVAQKSPKELTELIERVSGSEVRPPRLSTPSREALECPTRSTVLSHIAPARKCRGAACFPAVCDASGWGICPNTRRCELTLQDLRL